MRLTEEQRQRALERHLNFARYLRARPFKSCGMFFAAGLVYNSVVWMLHGKGNVFAALATASCLCVMPLVIRLRLGYVVAVIVGLAVGAAVGCLWVLGSAAIIDQPPKWLGALPFMVVGPLTGAVAAHMHRSLQTADEAGGS